MSVDVWEVKHDYWGARNGDIDNIETVGSDACWDNDENTAVKISIHNNFTNHILILTFPNTQTM